MSEPKGAQEVHSQLHPVISETHRHGGSGRRQRSRAVLELGLHALHVSPLPSDSLTVGGTPQPWPAHEYQALLPWEERQPVLLPFLGARHMAHTQEAPSGAESVTEEQQQGR